MIPDVLASRYSSAKINEIWSPRGKVILEREFWIAVMKAQQKMGVDIPESAIKAYEKVYQNVNLENIERIERKLRHDVKSRIEEFCNLAGHEHIHKGMTSRDLTDNVEQLQIIRSLRLIRKKTVAVLHNLSSLSLKTKEIMICGRTHNVPAQPTTLGKRLSMFGEEILFALNRLDHLIENYPMRGLQGAVGTQLDQSVLLKGNQKKVKELDSEVLKHFGCSISFNSLGQIYPRSLDMETVQALIAVSSGISNFARSIRLMAGQNLASEGFQKKQVGSSAMPHKMNTRTSERINGFHQILKGYGSMLSGLSGEQWNEGDVSCSVVRRVALPGSFFAADGLIEATLTVLSEMEFFEIKIAEELKEFLPFLTSTTLLMEAVKKGAGREKAYESIKEHAIAVTEELQKSNIKENNFAQRIAEDKRIPLDLKEIKIFLENQNNFSASAPNKTEKFSLEVKKWTNRFPEAKKLTAESII